MPCTCCKDSSEEAYSCRSLQNSGRRTLMTCLVPWPHVIYFILLWHDNSLFVLKVPVNTNQPTAMMFKMFLPVTKINGVILIRHMQN